jgi:hypothetical protein
MATTAALKVQLFFGPISDNAGIAKWVKPIVEEKADL